VIFIGKLLFQGTWSRGIGWHETLPSDIATQWSSSCSDLHHASDVSAPRWIGTADLDLERYTLHVSCDASERAYGAAIYRCSADTTSVQLVCSKARLEPLKRVTLPRLELLAALIGARLLRYVCQTTGCDITKTTMWTNSAVTLGWISTNPNR